MCGFVIATGQYSASQIRRATNLLARRGPDAEGIEFLNEIGTWFAHRRLSIRDLTSGTQPMWSHDRSSILVFNGEIYNDEALRDRLTRRGLKLRSTHSDTEVLLESLQMWGVDILQDLDGMFAFAWADLRSSTILLARDRFGQKPLYYSQTPTGLVAASETTSLHALETFSISEKSIQDYFNYGFLVPPLTLAQNMYQVCPGEFIRFRTTSRSIYKQSYWAGFKSLQDEIRDVSLTEIENSISQSLEQKLISDRPIGMLLSGGVDSSLVALQYSKIDSEDSHAFFCTTVSFGDKTFDEAKIAAKFASELRLAHNIVSFDKQSTFEELLSTLRLLDEPLGDSSFLPTYQAFKASGRNSTVTITGDGGDELFLGYDPFRFMSSRMLPRIFTSEIGRSLTRAIGRVLPVNDGRLSLSSLIEKLASSDASSPHLIPALMSPLNSGDARSLFGNEEKDDLRLSRHDSLWTPSSRFSIHDLQRWFLTVYLPGSILMKVDRASMLNSVEARPVFLDNELLKLALAMSPRRNVSMFEGKKTLRRLLKDSNIGDNSHLPKKGFGAPLSGLLRSPALRELMNQSIPGIDTTVALSFYDSHWARESDYRQFLYSYLSLVNSNSFQLMTKGNT